MITVYLLRLIFMGCEHITKGNGSERERRQIMNTLLKAPILIHNGNKKVGVQYYALSQSLMDIIFRELGNASAQLRIMIVLIGTKPNFGVSQQWILDRTGLCERSYIRARDELVKRGWLSHVPCERITVNFNAIVSCGKPATMSGNTHDIIAGKAPDAIADIINNDIVNEYNKEEVHSNVGL